jgi:hypothetical protein
MKLCIVLQAQVEKHPLVSSIAHVERFQKKISVSMHHGLFCDGPKNHSLQSKTTLHLLPFLLFLHLSPLSTMAATSTLDVWRIVNRNSLILLEINDDY